MTVGDWAAQSHCQYRHQLAVCSRRPHPPQLGPEHPELGGDRLPTGLLLNHAKTGVKVASNDLRFQNNIIAGMPTGSNSVRGQKNVIYLGPLDGAGSLMPTNTMASDSNSFGTSTGLLTWLFKPSHTNKCYNNADEVRLLNPFSLTVPSFLPLTTSPIVWTSASNTNPVVSPAYTDSKVSDAFFMRVSYIGAFSGSGQSTDNWASDWTNFDPQTPTANLLSKAV